MINGETYDGFLWKTFFEMGWKAGFSIELLSLNERKLLDYIKWINIDTLVNFSYTDFISKEKQDYTQETPEDVLNKIKHPSLITMEKIAKALKVKVDDLIRK